MKSFIQNKIAVFKNKIIILGLQLIKYDLRRVLNYLEFFQKHYSKITLNELTVRNTLKKKIIIYSYYYI